MKKKKIKIVYSCSDFAKHEHRYYFTAWICGRVQKFIAYIKRKLSFINYTQAKGE